ncbi:MAG: hypothetical protein F4106_11070 [Gemmatimonadetes bacterium]|nr:hypothetical protein [Gemmatimonadota bacterium]
MRDPSTSSQNQPGDQRFSAPRRTPLYEAQQGDRYERQRLIREIQEEVDRHVICYIGGKRTEIDRDDILGFRDLLCRIEPGGNVDLVLHSGGGDIDAAEKLISMVRHTVKDGELRVIVPHYAKSAATLMALGADSIVMSDTSELGPIDPQVPFPDGQGGWMLYSALSYLEANRRFTEELRRNPGDASVQILFNKFQPHEVVEIERAEQRTRHLAEGLLKTGMMAGQPVTAPVSSLMNINTWHTHGHVISAEDAQAIGLTVTRERPDDPMWAKYWKLYCLQHLVVGDDKKLFESDFVSLTVAGVCSPDPRSSVVACIRLLRDQLGLQLGVRRPAPPTSRIRQHFWPDPTVQTSLATSRGSLHLPWIDTSIGPLDRNLPMTPRA